MGGQRRSPVLLFALVTTAVTQRLQGLKRLDARCLSHALAIIQFSDLTPDKIYSAVQKSKVKGS